MSEYNIYCDESCHLPNDDADIMVIGGLSCPKEKTEIINKIIRQIKENHGVYKFAEIKWTKVSESKYEMYKDLIDLFFDNSFLKFRSVVALQKKELNLKFFKLSHDDWYQRIYFLTLREMIEIGNKYYIYADIKDTKGTEKIEKLKDVLNIAIGRYFYNETVVNVQLVRSDQIQLLQLADLLIGAVSYKNRKMDGNPAKVRLIEYIEAKISRNLNISSPKDESKLNIFMWKPSEV